MITTFINKLFKIDENYHLTSWLFLKGLALIYFIAFASLSVQIVGLVGSDGILPVQEFLHKVSQHYGGPQWWKVPTLFWFNDSDFFLQVVCYLGCFFSVLLFFGLQSRLSLIILFLSYLSLFHAGQTFLSFQWDTLLLESGFLAIFLYKRPTVLIIFLFHLLLFRLRFLSGLSKLLSGDPAWSGLTTLNYYFETQPLPHIGSWYMQQLPEWFMVIATALVLVMELIVPLFIFLPRKFKIFAAVSTIILQLIIIATSNHNFVNLLTILLCLFLLDDKFIQSLIPKFKQDKIKQSISPSGVFSRIITSIMSILLLSIILTQAYWYVFDKTLHSPFNEIARTGHHWGIGNVFHIFPTMQTERFEMMIEGSYDGKTWYPYQFKFKPNAVDQAPRFNVPHQPRLDWMIWFVPPQFSGMMPWFDAFMNRLKNNSPDVTKLLAYNPFADKEAPKFLRVPVYRYQFTNFEERKKTGNWWKAEFLGYFPNVPLRRP
ncbi:MAG: lipase maturation factor family protein [Gammaproteobacteria bacterium]|nr:lipase maturation factor family protein [Gammaproteobacteria bacterium]